MKSKQITIPASLALAALVLNSCNWPNPVNGSGSSSSSNCLTSSTPTGVTIQADDSGLSLGDLAQSFQVSNEETNVTTASLLLQVTTNIGATLGGDVTVAIEADSNGPDGVPLTDITANLAGGTVNNGIMSPTSFTAGASQLYKFTFSPITLMPSTTYWLVLHTSTSTNVGVSWLGSQNNPYPNGHAAYQESGTSFWTDNGSYVTPNTDLSFGIGCH